jgi:hypothetical protein
MCALPRSKILAIAYTNSRSGSKFPSRAVGQFRQPWSFRRRYSRNEQKSVKLGIVPVSEFRGPASPADEVETASPGEGRVGPSNSRKRKVESALDRDTDGTGSSYNVYAF